MLKTPPFLIGAVLLFWGWQTGMWVFAGAMAVLLEASHWVRSRMEFSLTDMSRIWDLCSLLTVLAGVYCVMTNDSINEVMVFFQNVNFNSRPLAALQLAGAAKVFFQWWPLLFFLAAAAQAYGTNDRLPYMVYSVLHRRRLKRAGKEPEPNSGVNFGFPYLAVCLYSGSLTTQHASTYYWVFAALCAWGLYAVRPQRFGLVTWSVLLVAVVAGGFVGQREFPRAAAALEGQFISMFWKWLHRQQRAQGFDTSIGHVGGMKGSGRIEMRVTSVAPPPERLAEASYCRFDGVRWDNPMWIKFEDKTPLQDGETWVLNDASEAEQSLTIARQFGGRLSGVAKPVSAAVLEDLPVGRMRTNVLGSVRAGKGMPFIVYRVAYGATNLNELIPVPVIKGNVAGPDLLIPREEEEALEAVSVEAGLFHERDPGRIVRRVARFFSDGFEYSLENEPSRPRSDAKGRTLVGRFLLDERRGHCEYFASATAMLLRYHGIPARYVLGWSIQEPGDGENEYVVRSRHAHSWVRYWSYSEERWRDLDTTPASYDQDVSGKVWHEPLSDWWSNRMYAFRMWRYYGGDGQWQMYLTVVLGVLIVVLAVRVLARRRRRVTTGGEGMFHEFSRLGLDSEFFEIERRIQAPGLVRHAGESLLEWQERLAGKKEIQPDLLRKILEFHYRYRFDPEGLDEADRGRLRDAVRRWLTADAR